MDLNDINKIKALLEINEKLIQNCIIINDFNKLQQNLNHRSILKDHLIWLYEQKINNENILTNKT